MAHAYSCKGFGGFFVNGGSCLNSGKVRQEDRRSLCRDAGFQRSRKRSIFFGRIYSSCQVSPDRFWKFMVGRMDCAMLGWIDESMHRFMRAALHRLIMSGFARRSLEMYGFTDESIFGCTGKGTRQRQVQAKVLMPLLELSFDRLLDAWTYMVMCSRLRSSSIKYSTLYYNPTHSSIAILANYLKQLLISPHTW